VGPGIGMGSAADAGAASSTTADAAVRTTARAAGLSRRPRAAPTPDQVPVQGLSLGRRGARDAMLRRAGRGRRADAS
jgi:hypothetical protein